MRRRKLLMVTNHLRWSTKRPNRRIKTKHSGCILVLFVTFILTLVQYKEIQNWWSFPQNLETRQFDRPTRSGDAKSITFESLVRRQSLRDIAGHGSHNLEDFILMKKNTVNFDPSGLTRSQKQEPLTVRSSERYFLPR
jgi:hypothetical protein